MAERRSGATSTATPGQVHRASPQRRVDDDHAGENRHRGRGCHAEQREARPQEGAREDGPEADPVTERSRERRQEGAGEDRHARDQADRRGEVGSPGLQALDEQRQVRPAHLVGENGDAEDEEDPAHRRVGEDADDGAPGEPEGASDGRDGRPDVA